MKYFFSIDGNSIIVIFYAFQSDISESIILPIFFIGSWLNWDSIESILSLSLSGLHSVLYSSSDNIESLNQGFSNNILNILSEQAQRPRPTYPYYNWYQYPFFIIGLGVKSIGPYVNDIISTINGNIQNTFSNFSENIQDIPRYFLNGIISTIGGNIQNIFSNFSENIQDISRYFLNNIENMSNDFTKNVKNIACSDYMQNTYGSILNYLNSIPEYFNNNFRVFMADRNFRVNMADPTRYYNGRSNIQNILNTQTENILNLNINYTPSLPGNLRPHVQITIFIGDILDHEDYTQIHSLGWLFDMMDSNPSIIIEVVDLEGVPIISRDISDLPRTHEALESLLTTLNNEASLTMRFMLLDVENIERFNNLHVFERSNDETLRVIRHIVSQYIDHLNQLNLDIDPDQNYLADNESDMDPDNQNN